MPGRVTHVFIVFAVVAVALIIFSVVCQVKIISKAGYSGWLVLTQFVPILGFVMFLIFAFGKWPIQERLERAEQGMGRGFPGPSSYAGTPAPGGGGLPGGGLPGGGLPGGGPGPAPSAAPPFSPPSGSSPPPTGPGGPGPAGGTSAAGLQPGGASAVIYCSWCGKERALNAQAIHHCGSMDRPAAYCMQCGTALEGALNCASCGTPSSKVSR